MRARNESGFVLTELLVVLVVSLILLSATLLTFDRMVRNSDTNDKRNDTAELARRTLEIEARQLRNLAKRVNNVDVIAKVTPDDFIFQTSDPSRTWVRYCLDGSGGSDNALLWEQTQAANTPGPSTSCPASSGWSTGRVVATNIVNRIDGSDRPMFSYRCVAGVTDCTTSTAMSDRIIGVDSQLFVDTTPRKPPEELRVATGVYLRNQNQAPTATFTSSVVTSSPRTVQLNASGSTDFEGRTLGYFWFLGTMPTDIRCDDPEEIAGSGGSTMWGGRFIGRGVVFQHTWQGTTPASGTAQTIGLVTCDPGDRFGYSGPQTVTIPQ